MLSFPSILPKPTVITLLTSLFTLGISVLSLAATAMVQLEKFVPVRGATAHEGRSRGDTFALPSPADPDPVASYEPPSYYTRLHPSPDGDAASDADKHVRAQTQSRAVCLSSSQRSVSCMFLM